MMQAAQLAAEAAMREAAASEQVERGNSGGSGEVEMPGLNMLDMMQGSSSSFMSESSDQLTGQVEYMQGLQQQGYDYPGEMRYQQEQQYYHDEQQYYHEQQHQERPGQGDSDDYNQMLLQEMQMMGIDPNDPEGVQFFLQYLQQREEQERQQADRPDEHYMTIAQNGMYKHLSSSRIFLLRREGMMNSIQPNTYVLSVFVLRRPLVLCRDDIGSNKNRHRVSSRLSFNDISVRYGLRR